MGLKITYAVGQITLILLLAPLISGIIARIKAFWQCRQGPGIWQVYYDILKYCRKDQIVSEHTSWIFKVTPYLTWGSLGLAGLFLPVLSFNPPLNFAGDVLAFLYLMAVARFFTALAALDAGSAFGGMGASREMAVSAIAEMALVFVLFVIGWQAGTLSLSGMSLAMARESVNPPGSFGILTLIALIIVAVAETGRIPVDNPDTHLELTMIHEGMLLEYSGKPLGLMVWAASVKQLLVLSLVAGLLLPWGMNFGHNGLTWIWAIPVYLLKVMVLGVILAIIETVNVKMRLFKVPSLLGTSFILALMALLAAITMGGS